LNKTTAEFILLENIKVISRNENNENKEMKRGG
jgi:hypothetical protein